VQRFHRLNFLLTLLYVPAHGSGQGQNVGLLNYTKFRECFYI